MKVAFAASDETVRLIVAEGFRALRHDRASHSRVVLTEVDPRDPRVLGGRAAVLLDIPHDQLSRFARPDVGENGRRIFEAPVPFVERFPIIASRAASPAVEPMGPARPSGARPALPPGRAQAGSRVGARRVRRVGTRSAPPDAAQPAPPAERTKSPLPDWAMASLPSLVLVLVTTVAMYFVTGADESGPEQTPRPPTTGLRSAQSSEPPGRSERTRRSEAGKRVSREAAARERVRRLAARSRPVGSATSGRLVGGVPVPREGRHFFTWNIPRASSPNPRFRRHGTYAVVQRILRVVAGYREAHPGAARVGIADLSLPRGGEFGVQYGGSGHVGHQNGTEVDILYPRRDRKEQAAEGPAQVDRRLSQDLLGRFLEAGAVLVEVDGRLGLRAPTGKIRPAPFHEGHMHVQFPR